MVIFRCIRSNTLDVQMYQVKYFWSSDQFLFWVKIIMRIYLSFPLTYWIIALHLWWKTYMFTWTITEYTKCKITAVWSRNEKSTCLQGKIILTLFYHKYDIFWFHINIKVHCWYIRVSRGYWWWLLLVFSGFQWVFIGFQYLSVVFQ